MQALRPSPRLTYNRGCFVAFGAIWLLFSCVPAAFIIGPALLEPSVEDLLISVPMLLLFEIPFFLVGVGMMVWGALPYVARTRIANPEIGISSSQLRLGESFGVTYQQAFKGAADVQRALVQLVFRERATYRRGTNTYTAQHDRVIRTFELPPRRYEAGESLHGRYTFEIPEDGMHSFEATRNHLQWLLQVHVVIGGWPDYKEEFSLTVLPERIA